MFGWYGHVVLSLEEAKLAHKGLSAYADVWSKEGGLPDHFRDLPDLLGSLEKLIAGRD